MMFDMCPCLTKTRAADHTFWSVKRGRVLNVHEMMRLQGAEPAYFQSWDSLVSARQMGGIIGNTMAQPIVGRMMRNIFTSMGILVKADRWA